MEKDDKRLKGLINLEEVNKAAKELYADGREEILLEALGQVDVFSYHKYPELILQCAKVHVSQGNHTDGRQLLLQHVEFQKDIPEEQARSYWMLGQLAYNDNDLSNVLFYVSKVQDLTDNPSLLAECEMLVGEAIKTSKPAEALKFFEKARKLFLRIQAENPLANGDVARVCLRASQTAFQQNMRDLGWKYLKETQHYAELSGNSHLINTTLVRAAQALEFEGDYQMAFAKYQAAIEHERGVPSPNQPYISEAKYRSAWVAMLMHDDTLAEAALSSIQINENARATCQYFVVYGWLMALIYDQASALSKLRQAETLEADDTSLHYQLETLRGFIQAKWNPAGDFDLEPLHEATTFFAEHQMLIEGSQAKLVLAWLYAAKRQEKVTQRLMDEVEDDLRLIGHVHHMLRLYEESMPLLGVWWQDNTLEKLETAAHKFKDGAQKYVRVYALGAPRIIIDGQEITYRQKHGHIGMKMFIFMLEKRQARLWEIIEAIYPDVDITSEAAINRFHSAKATFSKNLGISDWFTYSDEYHLYTLKKDFPHFYDVHEFNRDYDLFFRGTNPILQVAVGMRLLKRYNTFASTLEGEFFDTMRRQYEAQRDQVLVEMGERIESLSELIPKDRYAKLMTWLDTYSRSME